MGYWDGTKILVTGGSGFLGKAVLRKLHERGASSNVFAPRSTEYDLRDHNMILSLLQDFQPEVIIHMAAVVGGIGANRARPADFLYENLIMGTQLLHEAWRYHVKKFVTIGTVCAYPKFTPVPFKEDDIWDGYPEETNAPYGLAKKMLLAQGDAYRQQYGFNSIYLLPTNLYGPEDNFDLETSHVIPALIRKCLAAKERGDDHVMVWGTGTPTREFLYVADAAEGILLATEHYNEPDPVNLGSGKEISIKDLVMLIAQLTGFEGDIVWNTDKPDGQPRRSLDTKRAETSFGFNATTQLEAGLRQTIDWYEQNRDMIETKSSPDTRVEG